MVSVAPTKPRLLPHECSPLYFAIECLKLREWEMITFPAWAEPTVVSAAIVDAVGLDEDYFIKGIRSRHENRHKTFCREMRSLVQADLTELAPGVQLPAAVINYCLSYRQKLNQLGHLLEQKRDEKRRSDEVIARSTARRQLVSVLTGLFVTYGFGDIHKTALLAGRHTPTKDAHRISAWWHVRDALTNTARKIGPPTNELAPLRILVEAAETRDIVLRAIQAWNRMTALPEYRRRLNHAGVLEFVTHSGQLGAWLDEPLKVSSEDPQLGISAAVRRLKKHVDHVYGPTKAARGNSCVSLHKKGHRNASTAPSS